MSQHETMEVDVLLVGAGPANLSCAIHLMKLVGDHNSKGGQLAPMVALLEKGAEIGAHGFSGAVLDPCSLKELIPDFKEKGAPLEKEITKDEVYFLTEKGKVIMQDILRAVESQNG